MSTETTAAPAAKPAKQNQIAPLDRLKDQLTRARDRLAEVAPSYMSIDRLTRLMLLACGKSPKILACTPESILQFSMKCAETGLEPIGAGGCWPIPYGTVLTFVPDYRGLVNCAKRAGCIVSATAEIVRATDEFDYALGLEPYLTHKPARADRGDLEAAYCIYELPEGGGKKFVVMHRDDILSIKARSKAANSGPWVTDEAEMWKKTVIRRAMKPFAGMSSALDAAIEADDKATGAVEEKRDPVPMPKAIGEEPSTNGQAEQAPDEKPAEEKPEKEPKKITKGQTKHIGELIPKLDLPPAELASILENRKVSELTEAQADDVLAKLRKLEGAQSKE